MATAEAKLHVPEFTNEPFIDFSNAENRKRMEAAGKLGEFGSLLAVGRSVDQQDR